VYEGMVVGEHIRQEDLSVNVCKTKQLNNFRGKPKEDDGGLESPRRLSLDDFIELMAGDELLEVTPTSLRLRKRILKTDDRLREDKRMRQKVMG
jgi:GTP-binding protein